MMHEEEGNEAVFNNILKDIGKTKEEFEEEVVKLRQWLLEQPHLPHSADIKLLKNFVLASKSLQIAKCKLEYYYDCKKKNMLLLDRDPELIDWETTLSVAVLPGTTNEGIAVTMLGLPDKSRVHKWNSVEGMKVVFMSLETLLAETKDIGGHYFFVDLRNLSVRHIWRTSIFAVKSGFNVYLKALPVRPKGFFFLNCPPLTELALNLFILPFLSEKLRKRVHTYTGYEEILEHVPRRMVPRDYGGDNLTFQELCKLEKERLMTHRDFFLGH